MTNEPEEYPILEKGIQQILGKEEYPPPEISTECEHTSDGFVYEDTPLYFTFMCSKCGLHYDKKK